MSKLRALERVIALVMATNRWCDVSSYMCIIYHNSNKRGMKRYAWDKWKKKLKRGPRLDFHPANRAFAQEAQAHGSPLKAQLDWQMGCGHLINLNLFGEIGIYALPKHNISWYDKGIRWILFYYLILKCVKSSFKGLLHQFSTALS